MLSVGKSAAHIACCGKGGGVDRSLAMYSSAPRDYWSLSCDQRG